MLKRLAAITSGAVVICFGLMYECAILTGAGIEFREPGFHLNTGFYLRSAEAALALLITIAGISLFRLGLTGTANRR
jgi:hypothetical protein